MFKQNYLTQIEFSKNELSDFFSVVMPKVKNAIVTKNISEEELEKYKPKELIVKMYLDFNENNQLIADIKFQYAENEFNPLENNVKIPYSRNKIKETKSLNMLRKQDLC